MKSLIIATRTSLRAGIAYVKDRDVFVTEDLRLVRNMGTYPAIGIKDGGITFGAEAGTQDDESLQLSFSLQVKLEKQEAAIMGDTSTSSVGVLDMAADLIALPVSIGESEILDTDKLQIVMLPVTMKFERYS